MKDHICRESKVCTCYVLALEPNEACPQHGGGIWPPRCMECGRFLPLDWRTKVDNFGEGMLSA
jgi:hypothetical protein